MTATSAPSSAPAAATRPTVLPHHRLGLLATGAPRWRAIGVGATAAGLLLALLIVAAVAAVVAGLAGGWDVDPVFAALDSTDASDPLVLALLLASVAILLPALLVGHRLVGGRPIGTLSSVDGGLRWRFLLRCVLLSIAAIGVTQLPWAVLAGVSGELRPVVDGRTVAVVAVVLLLVPVQAAAEEYVFRGWLAQLIGTWLRHPAFAILLPVPLFVLGHDYGPLASLDIALFAVLTGWLTWRTGGLEAAIAYHVVWNCTGMLLGSVGLVDTTATETTWAGIATSIAANAIVAVLVVRAADRTGLARTGSARAVPQQEGRASH